MYKYGVHTYLFSQRLDLDLDEILDKAKKFGFDGIEVPFNLEEYIPWERLPNALRSRELDCTVCAGLPKDSDLISNERIERERGLDALKRYIDRAQELGSPVLAGVLSSAWGRLTGVSRTEEEWSRSVEGLQKAAAYAKEAKVRIALEPVNRFETHFINTVRDGKRLVEDIGSEWVGLLLDTFHMNIEETCLSDAVRLAGNSLFHFHACENDRGTPGAGHIDWNGIMRALKDINYSGRIVIESFLPDMGDISRETAIWRRVAKNGDVLAENGLQFLRSVDNLIKGLPE